MTRDDIIRMAREAHHELVTQDYPGHLGQLDPWTLRLLERFAALVAAQRQWVGLTAKDLAEIPPSAYEGAIWADAKLKEKNT
jgi:hypothetical protein